MTSLARAVIAVSVFVATTASAQDVEMNMNVQVDDVDMPAAHIQMKGTGPGGEAESMDMDVQAGGARMNIKMSGGRPAETSERTEKRERRVPEPRHHEEPRAVHVKGMASEPVFRDCGTGEDPGCTLKRDGQLAMDAETFRGVMKALKSTDNELTREDMAEKMFKRNYLTARQFGLVLDLFDNELTRLDVAKNAAPHVVNPQHSLGFSSKWENSLNGEDYIEIMSAQ
ncbi:DUF4476 domain-containing protein [Pyxidicoccus fallax]|uniref:DUF4476 domain-containing protein n=1 Tax=Pyxidicoccus fallax TaxID=394095 RepID=A0A848LN19_9BACT|nr:DUF4476 domain-containing protein [Pyxidicoccus fallax]NMO19079.1 DUF4476 domain-containing protein [Pyxidicoccus fallax]NPC79644.1 DUF4476 domain-containing protein [Pyxidicoccus fallax]